MGCILCGMTGLVLERRMDVWQTIPIINREENVKLLEIKPLTASDTEGEVYFTVKELYGPEFFYYYYNKEKCNWSFQLRLFAIQVLGVHASIRFDHVIYHISCRHVIGHLKRQALCHHGVWCSCKSMVHQCHINFDVRPHMTLSFEHILVVQCTDQFSDIIGQAHPTWTISLVA